MIRSYPGDRKHNIWDINWSLKDGDAVHSSTCELEEESKEDALS